MPEIIKIPEANTLYFQKNIPDIILKRSIDTNATKMFMISIFGVTVLRESYTYDSDGYIRVRDLSGIVEKYFTDDLFILTVTIRFDDGGWLDVRDFTVLKCEADITVDAGSWTAKNFLTRSYREKRTSKSRNEYLSFLQKQSYGLVTINFRLLYYLTDHWQELTGTLGTIAAATADKVSTFNASMGALVTASGIALDNEIIHYDIWLTGTGFETAKYTFLTDFNQYRDRKNFVFINSFGVLETFTATGRVDNKKTVEYNLGNIQTHYRKITQNFVAERTCNSGYLYDFEMDWIDDFLLSFSIAIYDSGSAAMEEITLTTVDKNDTEFNDLQMFQFGYRPAKNNHLQFLNAAKGIFDRTFDQTFE